MQLWESITRKPTKVCVLLPWTDRVWVRKSSRRRSRLLGWESLVGKKGTFTTPSRRGWGGQFPEEIKVQLWRTTDAQWAKYFLKIFSILFPPFLSTLFNFLTTEYLGSGFHEASLLMEVWGSVFWHFLPCDNALYRRAPCNLSSIWISITSSRTYICSAPWATLCLWPFPQMHMLKP